ncbi:Deoxyribose-phosphate aldolase [Escovopsis weberi]|uniref:deoxyribose-phosphate aldolase n=1 Tax=Escovopsis weberi TaxID=150374 RepID=A0A0M8MV60_ESCWE|nr:Deoxyribose-phosphate aldolase [Escovopsis weberi]
MPTVKVSRSILAALFDHSLLHPTLTDDQITAGLHLVRQHSLFAACVTPSAVPLAVSILSGAGPSPSPDQGNGTPLVCSVVGFPHGSSTTATKLAEAEEALAAGAREIDLVPNIGKVLSGAYPAVEAEVAALNALATSRGAILKLIFENDYLAAAGPGPGPDNNHILALCDMCTRLGVAFAKTSTGYGFVKQPAQGGGSSSSSRSGNLYAYRGATMSHLRLMRQRCGPRVQIKAAGGVRSLDDVLRVMALGVTRIGTTATVAILEEAAARGIGEAEVEVEVPEIVFD